MEQKEEHSSWELNEDTLESILLFESFDDILDLVPDLVEDQGDRDNSTSNKRARDEEDTFSSNKLPKVMKTDIRRKYFYMFLNMLNSFDLISLKKFFHQFCRNDCTLSNSCNPSNFPDKLIGAQLIYEFWAGRLMIAPDVAITLINSQIITRINWTGSLVTAEIRAKGTKLYNLPLERWLPSYVELERVGFHLGTERASTDKRKPLKSITATSESKLKEFDQEIFREDLPFLTDPVTIDCNCRMKFYLDENRMIERFAIESINKSS